MRSIRQGAITFGMVSVPIKLYKATESKNVSLRMIHAADGGRIKMPRKCSICDSEVAQTDLAKGYEDGDTMTILTAEDLESLPLPTQHNIDVEAFVDPDSIDPIRLDTSYYVEPNKGGDRAYALLREAMKRTGKVGVAKVTLRSREQLCLVRVLDDVLDDVIVLTTLLWPDEVRDPKFKFLDEEPVELAEAETAMAVQLVEAMVDADLDLDGFTDDYRTALENLIEAKQADSTVTPLTPERPDGSGDLMAALDASLAARTREAS